MIWTQYKAPFPMRIGRSHIGYGSDRRSSLSGQDSHGLYSSRQGMGYGGGSVGGGDVGSMYSSSFDSSEASLDPLCNYSHHSTSQQVVTVLSAPICATPGKLFTDCSENSQTRPEKRRYENDIAIVGTLKKQAVAGRVAAGPENNHNEKIDDTCPENVVPKLSRFEQDLTHLPIKVDISPENIPEVVKSLCEKDLPVSREHAEFVIGRRTGELCVRNMYEKYNNFLTNLVDYRPYITPHEKVDETYERLKTDNKLYDLPSFMVHHCIKFFRRLLLRLEYPYDSCLQERQNLLDCGCPIYKDFLKELHKKLYTPLVLSLRVQSGLWASHLQGFF